MAALPVIVIVGLFILILIAWFVWQLIKLVIVLILIAVLFIGLWQFTSLNWILSSLMHSLIY